MTKCPECGSRDVTTACFLWAVCRHRCNSCGYTWRTFNPVALGGFMGSIAGSLLVWLIKKFDKER